MTESRLARIPREFAGGRRGAGWADPRRAFDMIRYGFNVRTRTGQRVDNIMIMAPSQGDAERRLMQMYVQCEIIECRLQSVPRRFETLDIEGVIGMIAAAGPPSIQEPGAH